MSNKRIPIEGEDALTLAQIKTFSRWILERWESDSFDETVDGFKPHERTQLTAAFEKICTVAKWAADIEIYRKTRD